MSGAAPHGTGGEPAPGRPGVLRLIRVASAAIAVLSAASLAVLLTTGSGTGTEQPAAFVPVIWALAACGVVFPAIRSIAAPRRVGGWSAAVFAAAALTNAAVAAPPIGTFPVSLLALVAVLVGLGGAVAIVVLWADEPRRGATRTRL